MRFTDNVKAKFGTAPDLEIYHNGSNSFIDEVGTGGLFIRGDATIELKSLAQDEHYIKCVENDTVELYNNGAKKFETTATGITVSSTGAGAVATIEAGDANQASLDLKNTEGHYRIITDAGQYKIFDQTDSRTPFLIDTSGNATFSESVATPDLYVGQYIYHNGDVNTYIQFPGTNDKIVFATNGSDALTISADNQVTSSYTTGTAEGGGIDASDAVSISVGSYNGEIVTTIFVDIGVGSILSSGTAGDVIGNDGVAAAFVTKITTAINGLVYRGEMICLEVPTTGDPDINLSANASGTIAEDAAGEGEHVLINGGVATLAVKNNIAIPSGGIQEDFLYLTHGGTTAGTYDAGKFLIKLYGAKVTGI